MTKRFVRFFVGAAAAALVASCAGAGQRFGAGLPETGRQGDTAVQVVVDLDAQQRVQAIVAPYSAANVTKLEVIPYLEQADDSFKAIHQTTGLPTTDTDSSAVKASLTMVQGNGFPAVVRLNNLRGRSTYRITARAYSSTTLISDDASSSVTLVLTNDDAPALANIRLQLANKAFAAATTVTLRDSLAATYSHLVTELFKVEGDTEVAVPAGTSSISGSFNGHDVKLTKLQDHSTYRLKATAMAPGDAVVASSFLDIAITDDDAPAAQELVVSEVPKYVSSTLAGSAKGDGDGTGASASFTLPQAIAVDSAGTVYVADSSKHKIKKITSAGVATTLAGTGTAGSDDTAGTFNSPHGLAVDSSGNVYVADFGNRKIRKITSGGTVSTFAGTGADGSVDGAKASATFGLPAGLAVDANGNLYVADFGNHNIRRVGSDGNVTTVAGTGLAGYSDGATSSVRFNGPIGVAIDQAGNLYVAEYNGNRIRKISTSGSVSTVAGAGVVGFKDAKGSDSFLSNPAGVAVASGGHLIVADAGNHRLRYVSATTGMVATLAGTGISGYYDARGDLAKFFLPMGVAIGGDGALYVADTGNYRIRKLVGQ